MYAGRIVEYGDARDVLLDPQHPYTLGLMASTVHDQPRNVAIEAIPGSPPDLRSLPPGCSFAPRCKYRIQPCERDFPDATSKYPGRMARCFRAGALATPEMLAS